MLSLRENIEPTQNSRLYSPAILAGSFAVSKPFGPLPAAFFPLEQTAFWPYNRLITCTHRVALTEP
jgi:hypothetical protein